MTSFDAFVELLARRHGADAAEMRHELYFQSRRSFAGARGWMALARDAAMLAAPGCRDARVAAASSTPLGVLVVTLAGTSGWGTLERCLSAVRAAGLRPVVLAHPRLPDELFPAELPVLRPGGCGVRSLAAGLSALAPVAATRARRDLWRRAIRTVLGGHRGVLLLHNDFDMMSAASLAVGWPSVCIQHGAPTDEFFPCRADHLVVWGDSSADAFIQAGTDPARVGIDALGRCAAGVPGPAGPPAGLAVVSQTQASILGPALPGLLADFVGGLHALDPAVQVLLHPAERGNLPYGAVTLSRPPHALLAPTSPPALVLAYCSTFSLDAALAGHWVAALDFPLPDNHAARSVACPPLRVSTPAEAVALGRRLAEDAVFRHAAANLQLRWLASSFSPAVGHLEQLLRGLGASCVSS